MNSLPMSVSVMMPYTTRMVDGGIRMPSVPPDAMEPVASVSL